MFPWYALPALSVELWLLVLLQLFAVSDFQLIVHFTEYFEFD